MIRFRHFQAAGLISHFRHAIFIADAITMILFSLARHFAAAADYCHATLSIRQLISPPPAPPSSRYADMRAARGARHIAAIAIFEADNVYDDISFSMSRFSS
jgi:hypothetical protein